jgi:hypothetical protein
MAKTYKLRGATGKVRNPVVRAMIEEGRRLGAGAHGKTRKAERRANRVLTVQEARAMFAAIDYARDMKGD